MKTLLDESGSWFLESIAFDGDLSVVLVEGIRASNAEPLVIGGKDCGSSFRLEPTRESRRVRVTFLAPLAHQVVDECVAIPHDDEVHDGGNLREYSRSRWLEHLRATFVLEHPAAVGVTHYELVTVDDIIDVCCSTKPLVEPA